MTSRTAASTVVSLTERVFTLLDGGEYDAISELMTFSTARILTRDVVLTTWAAAVAEIGNLVACRETSAELVDGTVLQPDDAVMGITIGMTRLECEAGEWIGRLALDMDLRIIGLLVVPPGRDPLPF